MIHIVFKPSKAGIVRGEGLYEAIVNQTERLFSVRAKNAKHAEDKVLEAFRHNLTGKLIDYDLEAWLQTKAKNGILPASPVEGDAEVRPR